MMKKKMVQKWKQSKSKANVCIVSKLHACHECICSVHALLCVCHLHICFGWVPLPFTICIIISNIFFFKSSLYFYFYFFSVMRFKLRRWELMIHLHLVLNAKKKKKCTFQQAQRHFNMWLWLEHARPHNLNCFFFFFRRLRLCGLVALKDDKTTTGRYFYPDS